MIILTNLLLVNDYKDNLLYTIDKNKLSFNHLVNVSNNNYYMISSNSLLVNL